MDTPTFEFHGATLPPGTERLRTEIRNFFDRERAAGTFTQVSKIGMGFNTEFSRKCGEQGYIGMTWPKKYGGGEKSALERYVVIEEMLAAGAPVRCHWAADRQSGPVILRYGSNEQKEKYLKPITRGESFFCIGLSEPDSGSDLASVKTRAQRVSDGWVLNGTKLWTSNAHNAHYMIALCRTKPQGEDRYHGLTQFIVDLSDPGITIRPVINMSGGHDFNEVVFEDVFLPENRLLGTIDEGWRQVSAELAYERSGPERWTSTFHLLARLNAVYSDAMDESQREAVGRLFAHLLTLREMSLSIAGMLEEGQTPNLEAAITKDLGTLFEREIITVARNICDSAGPIDHADLALFVSLLESALLAGPTFTIRGGTTEMLRGTIARALKLR